MRACNATMPALDGKLPSACEFLAIGEALFALHGRIVKGGSASENHHVLLFKVRSEPSFLSLRVFINHFTLPNILNCLVWRILHTICIEAQKYIGKNVKI